MSQQRHAAARQLYSDCARVSLNCCQAFEIADVLLIGRLHEGKEQVLLAERVAQCQKEVGAQPEFYLLTDQKCDQTDI